jgi:hypothetical protein
MQCERVGLSLRLGTTGITSYNANVHVHNTQHKVPNHSGVSGSKRQQSKKINEGRTSHKAEPDSTIIQDKQYYYWMHILVMITALHSACFVKV